MIKILSAISLVALLAGCSSLKVVEVDAKTGLFPTTTKATVVKSESVDLDTKKTLILVPKSDFEKGQITNIKYFKEVMSVDELEKQIVQKGLQEKVPSIQGIIGINNAAKHYKDFLWLHLEIKGSGRDKSVQYILTDATTMQDYFIVETKLDYIWTGVNDQNNWYPMFNALIAFIQKNSKTYRK